MLCNESDKFVHNTNTTAVINTFRSLTYNLLGRNEYDI